MYLRVYLECISAPGAPGPVAEDAGGRVPRVLALAWLGLTHRAHRDDWLRGQGVVAHGERDYRHTRHAGTRERRLWRLRRRGRERRPLRPPGLLARLLDRPLCRHLLQPREGGLSAARMGAGSGAHLRGAARLASCRRRQLRPVLVVVGQLGGRLLGCRAVRVGQVALSLLADPLELGDIGTVALLAAALLEHVLVAGAGDADDMRRTTGLPFQKPARNIMPLGPSKGGPSPSSGMSNCRSRLRVSSL